jgi:hypothetical protein
MVAELHDIGNDVLTTEELKQLQVSLLLEPTIKPFMGQRQFSFLTFIYNEWKDNILQTDNI